MLDINGQLCTKMCMIIITYLVMYVKKIRIGNSKSYKIGYKFCRGTIYEMGI